MYRLEKLYNLCVFLDRFGHGFMGVQRSVCRSGGPAFQMGDQSAGLIKIVGYH